MNIEDRREVLKEKNACFNYLKIGHLCKKYRVNIKCAWCSKRHVILMCTEVTRKETVTKEAEHNKESTEESNLASIFENPQVFLQTLRVKLRNSDAEYIVRAIIDTGSQRSYILKQTAEMMGYEPVGEQLITHSLFDLKSDSQRHRRYIVRLSSLDGKYACNFKAFNQDVICDSIPCIKSGSWNKELRNLNIRLTDIEDNEENSGRIQILIGADVAGKLLTGRRQLLKCGLVAVETCLGWTIMGKISNTEVHEDATGIVLSMFVREENVSELWNLDTLGIKDPIETKSLKEHEKEVHEAFLKTVRLNENGRYEVRLPWLQTHPEINDNRDLAHKRLITTTKKLKSEGLFYEYNAVFDEWMAEGIIEEVPAEEAHNWGHYLPHRHVVKEKSTTRIRPVFDASAKDKSFPSLNQCLEKGPNFIELIVSLLLRFRKDAKAVMEKGCFDLRGWEYSGDDTHEDQAAVLGIIWNKKDDILTINVPELNDLCTEKITKRFILSLTHRIFDPLGFACPVMLFPKLLLQEAWAQKISWDDEIT
ncbi:PREDICTED: uncharacterized protein LOC108773288 [Cyphomyrmex costatus]|uniref:uncharacterized protein LOC108773288 n=1 Tax=Cyphomyrmex costatus TaxID=456900 RepID=UPI0008522756|nr:PREDICTED: uncharacterized protein LOC108773288 [Cyphomyrmex costatus]